MHDRCDMTKDYEINQQNATCTTSSFSNPAPCDEGPGVFNLERCAPCSFCWEDHDKPAHCHLGVPGWCRGPKESHGNI